MTLAGPRPLPSPSPLTEPFWAAARERRLVRPRCDRCAASFFTPQIACPRCHSTAWTYAESTGRGTVYSATVVHRAPLPGFEPPYRIAIVDLEEDWSMLANLIADGPVPIGTAVEVTWVPLPEGYVLPAFRPVDVEGDR